MFLGVIRFLIGLSVGSFLNVLSLRYEAGGRLFRPDVLRGRSFCRGCKKTLAWYELIPLASFILQFGRCRSCRAPLTWQYPIVELISGFALAFIPMLAQPALIWVPVVLTLVLITLIDMRLMVIPDQLNLLIGVLGATLIISSGASLMDILWNNAAGAVFGAALLGLIVVITRGRGMGIGDVKLAAALGLLFGVREVLLIISAAFVLGGLVGFFMVVFNRKSLKMAVPFGPFLSLAAVLVLLFGQIPIRWFYGLL
ncbi:MAG: prepilin peptidase [Candidatus Harrisonbacteria bacterium]|nr:prepilin peptidase [Candidatus Harrisonbacteria bacterium]